MNKKRIVCVFVAVMAVVMIVGSFILFPTLFPFVVTAFVLIGMLFMLNRAVLKKLYSQKDPFKIGGKIRNVNYLIIGDMINPTSVVPANKTYVQIKAPNRSLLASFEILRHTSSILDEDNGNVVICSVKKNKDNRSYTIFDTPFFYNLTIKKLGLETLNKLARFPVLIKPFSTIQLALDLNKKWKETECPNKDIVCFCAERNFNLKYYEN